MLVACERQNILKALIPADVVGTLYPFLSARGEVDFPMSSKVPPIALDGTSSYFAMENSCIFRIASAEQEISVGNQG